MEISVPIRSCRDNTFKSFAFLQHNAAAGGNQRLQVGVGACCRQGRNAAALRDGLLCMEHLKTPTPSPIPDVMLWGQGTKYAEFPVQTVLFFFLGYLSCCSPLDVPMAFSTILHFTLQHANIRRPRLVSAANAVTPGANPCILIRIRLHLLSPASPQLSERHNACCGCTVRVGKDAQHAAVVSYRAAALAAASSWDLPSGTAEPAAG